MSAPLATKKADIKAHWKDYLVSIEKICPSSKDFEDFDICFACGAITEEIHRAHIVARCLGGGDKPDNLHLLCKWCHLSSEGMAGEEYFSWMKARHLLSPYIDMKKHVEPELRRLVEAMAIEEGWTKPSRGKRHARKEPQQQHRRRT
jgi:hypothetical protein